MPPEVVGTAVVFRRQAIVIGAVVMVERRNGEQYSAMEGSHPGEVQQCVGFMLAVRCFGDLVVVLPNRSHQAQLIRRVHVENERSESAVAIFGVVNDGGARSLQSKIAAVSVEAGVVGKTPGVPSKVDLAIGLIEIAEAQSKFALPVAFEAGARNHIEDAVGAVAVTRIVAAALGFQVVNVFGIELRAHIAGYAGIWNRHSIDQPTYLVTAASV